ncbi:MAG: ATP-binding cassette domain-containing protein, partial [Burkholderiales bacterium]|nr:ATP-binding cassette domain-containing protein [Burkholderiales bacterium]
MKNDLPPFSADSKRGPIVKVDGLTKRVGQPADTLTILNNVGFEIYPAEAVAIVGASGSGKSTLLGLLAGLDTPSTGRVEIAGANLFSLDEDGR